VRAEAGRADHGGGGRHGQHISRYCLVARSRLARMRSLFRDRHSRRSARSKNVTGATIPSGRYRHWAVSHPDDPGQALARRAQFQGDTFYLAFAAAIVGLLTGIVVSTGPISVAMFLTYGLVKGAFLATEAASSLAVFASKAVTFQIFGALPLEIVAKGLITGSSVMAGAFIAKPFVLRLDPSVFRLVMDVLLLISGLIMLWNATQAHTQ
jgi:uncharacterized membrane protein YfcA